MHSLTPFGPDILSKGMVEENMAWNFVAGLTALILEAMAKVRPFKRIRNSGDSIRDSSVWHAGYSRGSQAMRSTAQCQHILAAADSNHGLWPFNENVDWTSGSHSEGHGKLSFDNRMDYFTKWIVEAMATTRTSSEEM
ncbi:hypothetical protein Tco_0002480 [Tanacetum coccineum]